MDTDNDGIGNNVDKDDDNDGLSDVFELNINTDPLLFDTDGDGISDSDEINYGGNAGAYTPGADLNPLLVDTDSDGFNDYVEVNIDSDPLDNQSTPAYVYGDISGDGIVNVVDLLLAEKFS